MTRRVGLAMGAAGVMMLAVLDAPTAEARGWYQDGPPVAHTGGFGEPTCHGCHFDAEPNAPGGELALSGIPSVYRPGQTYHLTVSLRYGEMEAGGFQLSARFAEGDARGRQAGSFHALDDRAKVTENARSGVQYAGHTRAGIRLPAGHATTWTLEWTAPFEASGPVAFHAAANAGNGDESQFGDRIYTAEAASRPR